MFGRRKLPFGAPPASPPQPPADKEPFPIDKMDSALDGAIRLFTKALDDAGVDAGKLAIRGTVPSGVTDALAQCTSYRGQEDGSLTFLVLGLTADFKQFYYPPHCRLYMIINSTGVAEDPAAIGILKSVAPGQFPQPLIAAHLMRRWIRFILPMPEAVRGGPAALELMSRRIRDELMAVIGDVPSQWAQRSDLREQVKEWASGFPGAIGRPLTPDVPRLNGLPMTPFIEDVLIKHLADLQMQGNMDR